MESFADSYTDKLERDVVIGSVVEEDIANAIEQWP